jgi:hypothetical protein
MADGWGRHADSLAARAFDQRYRNPIESQGIAATMATPINSAIIPDDRAQPPVRVDTADSASGVIAAPKRWREKTDPHGKDHDNGIAHFVNAKLPRNRTSEVCSYWTR